MLHAYLDAVCLRKEGGSTEAFIAWRSGLSAFDLFSEIWRDSIVGGSVKLLVY